MESTPVLQARIEDLLDAVSGTKGQKEAVALLKAFGAEIFDPMATDAEGTPWSVRMVREDKLDVVKALYPTYGKALLQVRGGDGESVLDACWAVVLSEMATQSGGYNDSGMSQAMKAFAWLLREVPGEALAVAGHTGGEAASEWLGRLLARCGRLGSSSSVEAPVTELLARGADANLVWQGQPVAMHVGNSAVLECLLGKGLDLARGGYNPASPDVPGHKVLDQRRELRSVIAEWRARQPVPAVPVRAAAAPSRSPPAPSSATSAVHSVAKGYLAGEWEHRAWRNIPVLWLALGRNVAVLDLLDHERVDAALQWRGPGDISPWVFAIDRMEGWWSGGGDCGDDPHGNKRNAMRTLHAQMQYVPVQGGSRGLVGSIIAGLTPEMGEDSTYGYRSDGMLQALRRVRSGKPEGRDYSGRDKRYWIDVPKLPWSEFWGTREEQGLLGGRLLGLLARSMSEAPDGTPTASLRLAGRALDLWLDMDGALRDALHPRLNGAMEAIYHTRLAADLIATWQGAKADHSGLRCYSSNDTRKNERYREQARQRYADAVSKIIKAAPFPAHSACTLDESDLAGVAFVRGQQQRQLEVVIEGVQAGGAGLGLTKAGVQATLEAGMRCRAGWAAMALTRAAPEPGRRRRLA